MMVMVGLRPRGELQMIGNPMINGEDEPVMIVMARMMKGGEEEGKKHRGGGGGTFLTTTLHRFVGKHHAATRHSSNLIRKRFSATGVATIVSLPRNSIGGISLKKTVFVHLVVQACVTI